MRFLGTELGILIGLVYILLPFIVLAVATRSRRSIRRSNTPRPISARRRPRLPPDRLSAQPAGSDGRRRHGLHAGGERYVTPALLSGGRITVFSMLIFQQYSSVFDFHYGGALSITLLVLTLALVALGRGSRDAEGLEWARPPPLVAFAALAFLTLPLVVLLGASVTATSFLAFPPQGVTLRWYGRCSATRPTSRPS